MNIVILIIYLQVSRVYLECSLQTGFDNEERLPENPENPPECTEGPEPDVCSFISGDIRSSENGKSKTQTFTLRYSYAHCITSPGSTVG